ncbi:hypothetical protein [Indiicoccus explosivorum]|uniref:hypothetical protein n=1 Tax=Indiicoccus explosivorum TaxID=1917864 RepID=UPI000B43417F|nr:hypothetical protein [Indiicoccus explosivorum]
MSMQHIVTGDLVHDEYGNYYQVVQLHAEGDTLKGISVSNLYFELSFEQTFAGGAAVDVYKEQPVGVLLQEMLNDKIREVQKNERPIYAIRDLMVNRVEVYAVDITKPHPKNNRI